MREAFEEAGIRGVPSITPAAVTPMRAQEGVALQEDSHALVKAGIDRHKARFVLGVFGSQQCVANELASCLDDFVQGSPSHHTSAMGDGRAENDEQ